MLIRNKFRIWETLLGEMLNCQRDEAGELYLWVLVSLIFLCMYILFNNCSNHFMYSFVFIKSCTTTSGTFPCSIRVRLETDTMC